MSIRGVSLNPTETVTALQDKCIPVAIVTHSNVLLSAPYDVVEVGIRLRGRERYVREFAGRHNIRELDTIEQMTVIANGMVGKRLRYSDLKAGR